MAKVGDRKGGSWHGRPSGPRWGARAAIVIGVLAATYACTSRDLMDTGGGGLPVESGAAGVCGPGHLGCPCDTAGQVADCGSLVSQSGDFVTCSEGHSVCQGRSWGPCTGDVLITKSLSGVALGSSGVHTLSVTAPCTDPCDPNVCNMTTSGPADVDASGLLPLDAGVSLTPSSPCVGLQCQVPLCAQGSPTTLTGTVYDPAGVNPINGAFVYIPVDPTGALPAIASAPSCQTCVTLGNVTAVATAQTGPDGKFTLTTVPSTDVAPGAPIPLVVQIGKWRREMLLGAVPMCTTTAVDPANSRLPRTHTDGNAADIPRIALVAGSQDPLECLFLKMGVSPSEFELPGAGTGNIDYYVATGKEFGGGTAPRQAALVGDPATLAQYDMVLLPCPGIENDDANDYADNLAAYANAGGRFFASHTSYTWLAMPSAGVANATNPVTQQPNPFYGVANWHLNPDQSTYSANAIGAAIDTTAAGQPSPKGQAFSSWLTNVGATSFPADVTLDLGRHDVDSVLAPSLEWMHHDQAPGETLYFTFDTPVGSGAADAGADSGGGACGRVGYADFHMSTADDVAPGQTCSTTADCGYGATCAVGTGTCEGLLCSTNGNCHGTGYTCSGATTGTCGPQPCQQNSDCVSNNCKPNRTCGCTQNSQCTSGTCQGGNCVMRPNACHTTQDCDQSSTVDACLNAAQGTCTKGCAADADCSAGELCFGGTCQGCTGPENCPSGACDGAETGTCTVSANTFPLSCRQTPLTPQEQALEFILLDLGNCGTLNNTAQPQAPPTFASATFTEDFGSTCPPGTVVVWREFDWQASIPAGASIDFSAQTLPPTADGGPLDYSTAQAIPIRTATTTTAVPMFDGVFLDTATGVFALAVPPVASAANLRLTVTLKPTPDKSATPALIQWRVIADCMPSE